MGMIALPICLGVYIICIIVGFGVIAWEGYVCGDPCTPHKIILKKKIIVLSISISIAVGSTVGMFFWGKSIADNYNAKYTETVYDEIYSLDRGSAVEGSFTLGSGTIDTYIAYYFYIETDHGFQLKTLRIDDYTEIYLVEDDNTTPHVVKIKEKGGNPYYIIYVPEGTVVQQFEG